jgi:hypothetical protein
MYKIKFLSELATNRKGNKAVEKFHTVALSESEIERYSRQWKAMGFVEVKEVMTFEKTDSHPASKLSASEIIEMFYSPKLKVNGREVKIEIDEDDLLIKESLLKKYGKSASAPKEKEPNANDPEDQKELRKRYFKALKDNGIGVAFNMTTEKLIEKAKENNIEI